MPTRAKYWSAVLLLLSCYVVGPAQTTVITHVSVITMDGEEVLADRAVYVEGSKIVRISESHEGVIGANLVIDGTDKFLMPGLSEMHAHIPTPRDGDDSYAKETLFLYLANGITTIRGMLGHPYHLTLKKELKEKHLASPRIYTSSPSMNGNTIPTAEEAVRKVGRYARDGYDFLKVHPGIQREVFDKMVETALTTGIGYSGHVPMDVGVERAIESQYGSIDHLDGYIEGLAPEERRPEGGFFGVLLSLEADEKRIETLVQQTKEAGVAVVPTQTLMTRWLSPESPVAMVNEPEMKYLPASERFRWRQSKEQMLDRLSYSTEMYDRFIELRNTLILKLHQAEVPILLGSDAPQVMNVPGFSIHHEIEDMVDAGLSNYEALKTGTVNVAEYFGAGDKRGKVKVGMVADLVLLADNPLDDIGATRTVEGVMYRGAWLDKATIEVQLAAIADKYDKE